MDRFLLLPIVLMGMCALHVQAGSCACKCQSSSYAPLDCPCGTQGSNVTEGYCASCYQQPPCKNISYPPGLLKDGVFDSPFYLIAVIDSPHSRSLVSVCYTYFFMNQSIGQYFLLTTELYKDGTRNVQLFIDGDVPNEPGKVIYEGFTFYGDASSSAIVATEVGLGSFGPNQVFYRCYEFENCCNPYVGQDFRYALSNVTTVSEIERKQIVQAANNPQYQFRGREFVFKDNATQYVCATSFFGAKCIGADKVKPQYSFAYPF